MRTLELLRSLSDREITKTDELVKGQKRKSLQLLYGLLKKYRKRSGVPTNEELYAAAFGDDYNTEKNYLVRHELRLLNEILYDYLILDTFSESIGRMKTSYHNWLGQTFLKRQLHNAFAADIDRFIEHAKDNSRPDDRARLLDMKSNWITAFGERTVTAIKEQLELSELVLQSHIRSFRYKLRDIESKQAFLKEYLSILEGTSNEGPNDWRTEPIRHVDLGPSEDDDLTEQALVLRKYIYQTRGLKRIEMLTRLKEINEIQTFDDPQRTFENRNAIVNNIAVEYEALHDFNAAEKWLYEAVEICHKAGKPVLFWIVRSFIANQLNQGRYAHGIAFFEEHGEAVKDSAEYFLMCITTAYCHLFLGQTDKALAVLPPDTKLPDQHLLQLRMVYLISFIIRNDLELAINECRNITRMIKANEGPHYQNYEWIANIYSKYLKALTEVPGKRSPDISKLLEDLNADGKRLDKLQYQEPSLLWLVRKTGIKESH